MSKVVLITGVRSKIGTIIAKHLVEKGYKVYGTTRKNVGFQADSSSDIQLLKVDLNDKIEVENTVKSIIQKEGKIDVLINNASIGITGPMEELDMEDIESIYKINIFGTIQITQAILPYMRKEKNGLIINLSSIGGQIGLPFRGAFSSTKFAIEGLSETLSMELKQFNINVCLVEPGSFKTNQNTNRKVALVSVYSPYKANFDATTNRIQQDREETKSEEKLSKTIEKIIESKNPNFRYHVSSNTQKIVPFIKTIIPYKWFEKLVMKHYSISSKEVKINQTPEALKEEERNSNNSSSNADSIFKM